MDGDRNQEAHRETARGWDAVAREKYDAELDEHLARLRAGGHNLLDAEAELIGDLVAGADVVHFQCSHGLDALGFLNLGARSVLGIDISEAMIDQAKRKAAAFRPDDAAFLCADVIDLPEGLEATADIVYTGRGSLPWVLDLDAWAASVRRTLKPGGHIFLLEGHPLDALWDRAAPGLRLRPGVGYFDDVPRESPGFPASAAERALGAERPHMVERQWRPGEVVEALLGAGLRLVRFRELPVLYWNQFPGWPAELVERLPHSYVILAVKRAGAETTPSRSTSAGRPGRKEEEPERQGA